MSFTEKPGFRIAILVPELNIGESFTALHESNNNYDRHAGEIYHCKDP